MEVSTRATPLSEVIIHERGENLPMSEGKDMVTGGERAALDQGIINKVEESLSLSLEGNYMVSGAEESMMRERANARAENEKLRALEKKKR